MTHIDTIIIGGGLAGLYTALRLRMQKIPFILLEAKSTLGGRISSQSTLGSSNLSVDLGPTWFWPHQQKMKQLTAELNIECFEQHTAGDVLYQLRPDAAPSRTLGAGTSPSFRIKGGMQKLITALAEAQEPKSIKLNYVVTSVERVNKQWEILVNNENAVQKLGAKRLIVAVPPRIMLRYLTPEKYLSNKLIQALASTQTWMAGQAKFVAVYKKTFWCEQGLAGQAFSQVGPMVEIHDASSAPDEGYALFGFMGLDALTRSRMSTEQLKAQCIDQLVAIFGNEAKKSTVCYLSDWARDKYVATAQDIKESPKHSHFLIRQHTEELTQLNLHLVSTEVSQSEPGYLEGALSAVDDVMTQFLS
jgi:monoamine oxidase